MAGLPGPPLGGAALAPRMLREPHTTAQELHRRYGDVVAIGFGPSRYVFLFGPDANRLILSERPDAFLWGPALKALEPVDGPTALVLSDGDDHRRRRRLVQPAFASRRIETYEKGMEEEIDRAIDDLVVGSVVDVHATFRRVVRRIVVRALFGDSFRDRADELGDVLEPAMAFADRIPQLQLPWLPAGRRARAARAAADRIVDEEAARPDPQGILAVLVESDLSRQEVRDQVVSLIAAGYDTTSAAVAWAIYELLRNERWTPDQDLDHVVKETQRLWPGAAVSGRQSVAPVELRGHEIPAGTMVLYSPWVTHRMPSLWERPDEFVPERWEREPADPYAYVPFGGGYRRCIGFQMAVYEIKIAVARMVRAVDASVAPEQPRPKGLGAMYPDRVRVTVSAIG